MVDSQTQQPAQEGEPKTMTVSGLLDLPSPSEGRLRQFKDGFVISPDDPVIGQQLIEQFHLRPAQELKVDVTMKRPRRRSGRKRAVARHVVTHIHTIDGVDAAANSDRLQFGDLIPIDPAPRMTLEHKGGPPACRLIDLFCPLGYGSRGLIVAPPKAGKTILLQNIANGIHVNHPDVKLVALLIDERPEEVTDFRRNVPAEVLASSNDMDIDRHIELGILAIERAKRLLESGRDVVVLLDSITRLGRAFNNSRKYGSSGRTMSGGLDSRALEVPKQMFGAARNVEGGGSLTILATCLVDTGSRADQIIYEEFKGTGNMELILDRSISELRLYPAINLAASGTRKEDLLMEETELKTVTALRRRLLNMKPPTQIEQLLGALKRFETNEDLVRG
jgi:transcription termination factor Rho